MGRKPARSPAERGDFRLAVRVTPRSDRDAVDGAVADAGGGRVLRIRVRAVPEDGRANDAVIGVLSEALDCPPSKITLVEGAASRRKVFGLNGDPDELARRIQRLLGG